MLQALDLATVAICTVAALTLVHIVAWRTTSAARFPELASSRAWARTYPLRARLETRAPGLHAWLAGRLDPGSFNGLLLTFMVLAALCIVALLAGLAENVIETDGVVHFDQAVNAFLGPWRGSHWVEVFLWVTALGDGPTLTAVAVVATGFLWIGRRYSFVLPLWVTFLGAQATTWAGKYAIARPRPEFIQAAFETSPSFPSGHATAATALYGFLAYVLVRDLPDRRPRFEVVFWTAALILAIDVSRIFLSVHYTSDVIAGNMVGGIWLLVGFAIAEWARARGAAASYQIPVSAPIEECSHERP
jgi:undecaprenyl-diphosphatase